MREVMDENEYKAKYLQLKYRNPATTPEEWQEFCFELLEQLMEQNEDVLKRLKEMD